MPTPPRHPTTVLDGTTPPKPLARPKSLSATHQPKLVAVELIVPIGEATVEVDVPGVIGITRHGRRTPKPSVVSIWKGLGIKRRPSVVPQTAMFECSMALLLKSGNYPAVW